MIMHAINNVDREREREKEPMNPIEKGFGSIVQLIAPKGKGTHGNRVNKCQNSH